MMDSSDALIKVAGLKTHFFTGEGVIKAVDGVDLAIASGEVLGLVGESGCGKSMTALSIIGLVPSPGRIVAGEILFKGLNLLSLSPREKRRFRGEQISMIFQDPLTSLNPVLAIGTQVSEVFMFHKRLRKKESWSNSIKMLQTVGIPSSEMRVKEYPHQLSGGMRQRTMIAMGLACKPSLLIADEPTTALDVTVQAQILDLINEMCHALGTAVLLITHNMGIVAKICDQVAVMYAGNIMEYTDVYTLFKNPQHPYTIGLLNSLPRLGEKQERLNSIKGLPPRLNSLPPGCPFWPRCPEAEKRCGDAVPELVFLNSKHKVRCIKRG
jgi:peptide/nickel transport system ATP-binding protein